MTRFAHMFPIHFPSPTSDTYQNNYDAIDWGCGSSDVHAVEDCPVIGQKYKSPVIMSLPHILLVGFKRAGKDTVAKMLQEELIKRHRIGSYIRPLAGPLKEVCKYLFGWDDEHLNGALKEEIDPAWGFSPRRAQQLLGTEFGRALDPELWCKVWAANAKDEVGTHICPDGRFLGEARFFKKLGGQVWIVERPGCVAGEHASEHDQGTGEMLSMADELLVNDGSLDQLRYQVGMCLDDLIEKARKETP